MAPHTFRKQALRVAASLARRWADAVIERATHEPAAHATPAPASAGGPPAHWVEKVRAGAPELLRDLPDAGATTLAPPPPRVSLKKVALATVVRAVTTPAPRGGAGTREEEELERVLLEADAEAEGEGATAGAGGGTARGFARGDAACGWREARGARRTP